MIRRAHLRSTHARTARLGALAGCLLFGGIASVAAQGTPEQQEACAPDAVKLCSDTIPDVGRTTACMKRHEAELSPRCHRAFIAATGSPDRDVDRPVRRRARPAPTDEPTADAGDDDMRRRPPARDDTARGEDDGYGPRRYQYLTPDGGPAQTGRPDRDARSYDRGRYDERGPDDRGYDGRGPDEGAYDPPPPGESRERARAEIDRLCQDGELDPRTCETTQRALDGR